jgi:hypothetical protein
MSDDSFLPFDLPAVSRKKMSANFDGGAISSDGGLLLLREADRRLGLTRMSCVLRAGPARSLPDQPRGGGDAAVPHGWRLSWDFLVSTYKPGHLAFRDDRHAPEDW